MDFCKFCMKETNADAVCPYCHKDLTQPEPPHHLAPGTVLQGKYVVGAAIGEGGFGITYVGKNTRLDMKVAIKEYYPNGYVRRDAKLSTTVTSIAGADGAGVFEKGKTRFLEEAQMLGRFTHEKGVVSVHDFFEENDTAYIVMEFLEGQTLGEFLKEKKTLSPEETLTLLTPAMRSLEKVHKRGFIHRDISPDNIMLTEDSVKLLDFGAARDAGGEKSRSVMLKHGYAPIEQYSRKGEQGAWTDVYALCATMYKCITGITPDEAVDRMTFDELKPPSALGVTIDPAFEKTLMKGLAIQPRDRCRSIAELLAGFGLTENGGSAGAAAGVVAGAAAAGAISRATADTNSGAPFGASSKAAAGAAADTEPVDTNTTAGAKVDDAESPADGTTSKPGGKPQKTIFIGSEEDKAPAKTDHGDPDATVDGENTPGSDPDKTVCGGSDASKESGAPQPAPGAQPEKPEDEKEKKSKKGLIIVLIAAILIIAGVIIALFAAGVFDKPGQTALPTESTTATETTTAAESTTATESTTAAENTTATENIIATETTAATESTTPISSQTVTSIPVTSTPTETPVTPTPTETPVTPTPTETPVTPTPTETPVTPTPTETPVTPTPTETPVTPTPTETPVTPTPTETPVTPTPTETPVTPTPTETPVTPTPTETPVTPTPTETPVHTHVFGDWTIAKEASCTEEGVEERYCSCGEKETRALPAKGHTVVTDPAVAASCTTAGKTAGSHCSACGAVITAQTTIPATGHDWGAPTYSWSDDNSTVTATCVCNRDSSHIETETAKTTNSVTKSAKCETAGTRTYTASFGNHLFKKQTKDETIPATGHTLVADPAVAATCTKAGKTAGSHCSVCGAVITAQTTIPATGHDWGDPVFTWSEYKASAAHICSVCSAMVELAVTTTNKIVKQATCTETGIRTYTATVTVDGKNYTETKDRALAKTAHTYGDPVFTWSGYTATAKHVCSACGSSEALSVSVTNSVTKQPNCTETGTKTYTAKVTVDGKNYTDSKTETLAAAGHDYVNHVCTRCGDILGSAGLEYTLIGDSYSVAAGDCYDDEVYIPKEYNGKPVTVIGNNAFQGYSNLISVTIPDSVTTIRDIAFSQCSNLTSVTIPDSVTSIGNSAFYGCESLTSVSIPNGVTTIDWWSFAACNNLKNVTIPDSVNSICGDAFSNCKSLTSVTIPDSVTSIGNSAFYACDSLTSVTIGKGVTSIGENAFHLCYKLIEVCNRSSLKISAGSSNNGMVAFYAKRVYSSGSSYLRTTNDGYIFYEKDNEVYLIEYTGKSTELTLPDKYNGKNYEIYKYAFCGFTGLTSITIGKGATSIGDFAFSDCASLISVTIPDSVTLIGCFAFSDCGSLTSVMIGKGMTSIDPNAFDGCQKLESVTIHSQEALDSFNNWKLDSIKNVVIGGGVTTVGAEAFYDCTSLTNVTIGSGVTSIGEQAFYGCTNLTSVTIGNSVTSFGENAFNLTIVPAALHLSKTSVKLATIATDTYDSTISLSASIDYSHPTITITPATSQSSLTWSSSNTKAATVNNGVVTGVGNGTAVITAKKSNTVVVRFTITVTSDRDGILWSSSDPSVATVSSDGKVSAAARGYAAITATTDNGISATCSVTVGETYKAIKLDSASTYGSTILYDYKEGVTYIRSGIMIYDEDPAATYETTFVTGDTVPGNSVLYQCYTAKRGTKIVIDGNGKIAVTLRGRTVSGEIKEQTQTSGYILQPNTKYTVVITVQGIKGIENHSDDHTEGSIVIKDENGKELKSKNCYWYPYGSDNYSVSSFGALSNPGDSFGVSIAPNINLMSVKLSGSYAISTGEGVTAKFEMNCVNMDIGTTEFINQQMKVIFHNTSVQYEVWFP